MLQLGGAVGKGRAVYFCASRLTTDLHNEAADFRPATGARTARALGACPDVEDPIRWSATNFITPRAGGCAPARSLPGTPPLRPKARLKALEALPQIARRFPPTRNSAPLRSSSRAVSRENLQTDCAPESPQLTGSAALSPPTGSLPPEEKEIR